MISASRILERSEKDKYSECLVLSGRVFCAQCWSRKNQMGHASIFKCHVHTSGNFIVSWHAYTVV